MAIPDYQSLMLPTLKSLEDDPNGNGVSSSDIRARVADEEGLTPEDQNVMTRDGRQSIFTNRISWALVYMRKAGLVERAQPGVYRLTDGGRELLATGLVRIDKKLLNTYPEFVEWHKRANKGPTEQDSSDSQPGGSTERLQPPQLTLYPRYFESDKSAPHLEVNESSNTPEEMLVEAYQQLENALETDMLDRIRKAEPAFLEQVMIDLLIAMNYGGGDPSMGHVTQKSRDGGIDGKIREDALGLDEVYVQAKRYDEGHAVGSEALDRFVGAIDKNGTTKGVFVTTSSFTKGAEGVAQSSTKRIVLIDGKELVRLMIKHDVGVRVGNTYKIKKLSEDYFEEGNL